MDFNRAREIFNSPENIEVLLDGTPVWIENLDPGRESARVRPMNGKESREVPVAELVEGRLI